MAFWRSKKTEDLNPGLDDGAAAEEDAFSKHPVSPTQETEAQSPLASDLSERPSASSGATASSVSSAAMSSKALPPPPPQPPPFEKVLPPRPPPPEEDAIPIEAVAMEPEGANFGIEQAVELLRELPSRNIDLVMSVVAKTLESVNVDVASLVRSAEDRTKEIEGQISSLKQDIGRLDEEIRVKKKRILDLEDKQREVAMVKDRLSLVRNDRAYDPNRRATGTLNATGSQSGTATSSPTFTGGAVGSGPGASAGPSGGASTSASGVSSDRPTLSMRPTPPPPPTPSILPTSVPPKESGSRPPGPRLPSLDLPKLDEE